MTKIDPAGPTLRPDLGPCEIFTGSITPKGYGQLKCGKEQLAHRSSWVLRVGDIPAGMQVLHKCDNPRCVRPSHLFLGTVQDNVRDMIAKGRHAGVGRTHCARGHPFDEANTYVPPEGGRACRACRRLGERRRAKKMLST